MSSRLFSLALLAMISASSAALANPMMNRRAVDLNGKPVNYGEDSSPFFSQGSVQYSNRITMMKEQNVVTHRSADGAAEAVGKFFENNVDSYESVVQIQLRPIAFTNEGRTYYDAEEVTDEDGNVVEEARKVTGDVSWRTNHSFLPFQLEIAYQLKTPGNDPVLQGTQDERTNNIVRLFRASIYQFDIFGFDEYKKDPNQKLYNYRVRDAWGMSFGEFTYENNPMLNSSSRSINFASLTISRIISAKRNENEEGLVTWVISGEIRPANLSFDRLDGGFINNAMKAGGFEVGNGGLQTDFMGREFIAYRPEANFALSAYLGKRARLSLGASYSAGLGQGRDTRDADERYDRECDLAARHFDAPHNWDQRCHIKDIRSIKYRSHRFALRPEFGFDAWTHNRSGVTIGVSAAVNKDLLNRIELNGANDIGTSVNRRPLWVDLGAYLYF